MYVRSDEAWECHVFTAAGRKDWQYSTDKKCKGIFTVHNISCGKVMFSQVSVCPRRVCIYVLGRFSHFNIAIAHSNSTFCGAWTPSFCAFTWKLLKYQQTEHTSTSVKQPELIFVQFIELGEEVWNKILEQKSRILWSQLHFCQRSKNSSQAGGIRFDGCDTFYWNKELSPSNSSWSRVTIIDGYYFRPTRIRRG